MTLQNLLRIGRLKEHTPTAAEVLRRLEAVDRNLADAAAGDQPGNAIRRSLQDGDAVRAGGDVGERLSPVHE